MTECDEVWRNHSGELMALYEDGSIYKLNKVCAGLLEKYKVNKSVDELVDFITAKWIRQTHGLDKPVDELVDFIITKWVHGLDN